MKNLQAVMGYLPEIAPFGLYYLTKAISQQKENYKDHTSWSLAVLLAYNFRQLGVPASLESGEYEGEMHTWVVSSGTIWDPLKKTGSYRIDISDLRSGNYKATSDPVALNPAQAKMLAIKHPPWSKEKNVLNLWKEVLWDVKPLR